jgi:hypothetical protein
MSSPGLIGTSLGHQEHGRLDMRSEDLQFLS